MKGVFVVLDGVADEPCAALDGKTPLEVAKTPHLDALAKKSRIDYCYPIKEGVIPQSSSAMVSLFGYDPHLAPRGPLEAQGAGIKIAKGDLVLRTNFGTIDDIKSGNILDRRAGRTLSTKEAYILSKAINDKVKLQFPFTFYPTLHHRGVLVIRGGFSDNISNTDPDYGHGVANERSSNKIKKCVAMDDEEDSVMAADLVNSFIRQSYEVLDNHPLNKERVRKGLFSANFIFTRDAGNSPVSLPKLKGKWMALGYMPLEIGLAKALKMDLYSFRYPKMKRMDVYENLHLGLRKAAKYSVKMMKRCKKKHDYFYVHIKETDIPGHDNKPHEKVKMIEYLDLTLFAFLEWFVERYKIALVVTADHTTACRLKAHSASPVPVLYYRPEGKAEERRFTEKSGLEGKKIIGRKLLESTLFEKV